ncbi:AlpA family transcriptional regulator [Sphingomonas sp. OK281]|uniref:helix-turn-helix transcriptional regulator n=1 Tax=Sphingomonas sp. OK281 TaxID=1881067 RepID=UPI0008EB6DCD|nr:AlpA family phage regulatory protein [Sphingomonas sp. OK281]SFO33406.1 transcriptional regulator, AlpA family [Sphingomonas sp. OK281]
MSEKPDSIIRIAEVRRRTGLTWSTLYRKVSAGTFPGNVRISLRCVGWRELDVEAWLRNNFFYSVADNAG